MEMLLFLPAIEAFGLFLARTSAMVVVAPVLGNATNMSGYKIALAVMIAGLLYVSIGKPLPAGVDELQYGLMVLREIVIGLFLGFTLSLILIAAREAGELVGHEMGFMVGREVDPISGVQSSLIATLYENLFLVVVLMLNGHHLLIRSLSDSFAAAPIGKVAMASGMAGTFEAMFSEMFRAGIVFAAPVLIFLIIVSVLIGILSRAVPTLNVLELGFSMRLIVALGAMYLFAPLLEPSMLRLFDSFSLWLNRGVAVIGK
ncbi:MAG TPA: type III secretion protein [Planctomycetes bacterium]|nr:type III secretion protein [Planctomycetota bacterium]